MKSPTVLMTALTRPNASATAVSEDTKECIRSALFHVGKPSADKAEEGDVHITVLAARDLGIWASGHLGIWGSIRHVTANEVGIKPPLLAQPKPSLLSFVF